MVGASLKLASRQESFQDSRVGALTNYRQVGAIPQELQGVDSANSLFSKKQKYFVYQHAFLSPNIQHSTFHHSLTQMD